MNSKTTTSTIYNSYQGLLIDNDTDINSTTSNLIRKLRKKINEINILETKDPSLLNKAQKLKISKKGALLEQLQNELDKETSYIEKERHKEQKKKSKKKEEKSFLQLLLDLEREQTEHKAKEKAKKQQKYEKWRERMKKQEAKREEAKREEAKRKEAKREEAKREEAKHQRRYHTCDINVLNACKVFDIKFSELNATNLKKAYRKLILLHHPDKGGDEKLAKQIINANLLLKEYLGDYN